MKSEEQKQNSIRRSTTQQIDSTGEMQCKIHGRSEIGIDPNTFKLVCKKCLEEGKSHEDNLVDDLKNETRSVGLDPSDFTIDDDLCSVHPNQKIIFFCEDCNELLCKSCFQPHRHHNTIMPEVIKEKLIEALKESALKVKSIQPRIEDSLKELGEINNQIKSYNSTSKTLLNNLKTNLDKILKTNLKSNYSEFVLLFENIDNEVEDAFNRLNIVHKKCNKLQVDITEVDTNLGFNQTSLKKCEYIKKVSSSLEEAKKIIIDSRNFLGSKIKNLKLKGDEEMPRFLKLKEDRLKREKIYEKSINNSTMTGATSQSIRLRRFFKYTIEDLSYFRTSTVFMSSNKNIILTGLGICGLLEDKKTPRSFKMNISINEMENGIAINNLVSDNVTLGTVVNNYDPCIAFFLSKVIVLRPGVVYAITCSNLDLSNQYVEIWRGKVYLPSNQKELLQDVKCNNTRIDFKFTPSKGLESDFNEFNIGIISDLLYSPVN